jgi:hypothetical protein
VRSEVVVFKRLRCIVVYLKVDRIDVHVLGIRTMAKKKIVGENENGRVARKPWTEADVVEFVRHWESAGSVAEVSRLTGLAAGTVYSKARLIKKAGVTLKPLTRGSPINWSAVKAALSELVSPVV